MCVNTDRKWRHTGKGTRWQTHCTGSALSFPWKTWGALPILGHMGGPTNPTLGKGTTLKAEGLGLCHV